MGRSTEFRRRNDRGRYVTKLILESYKGGFVMPRRIKVVPSSTLDITLKQYDAMLY